MLDKHSNGASVFLMVLYCKTHSIGAFCSATFHVSKLMNLKFYRLCFFSLLLLFQNPILVSLARTRQVVSVWSRSVSL